MQLLAGIVGLVFVLFVGLFLYALGGWLLLVGVLILLVFIGIAHDAKKLKSDDGSPKVPKEKPPAPQAPALKPVFTPTPEQLAQIEQARQSSLATLEAQEKAKKAAAKTLSAPNSSVIHKPSIDPIELPDRIEFTYKKSDGTISHRTVNVNHLDAVYDKFTGFCETSGSVKTFKVGSVQGLVTRHETGEMVKAKDWFKALKPSEKNKSRSSRNRSRSVKKDWVPAVALLGFHPTRYEQLAAQVEASGMQARFRLSDTVMYVVFGPNAGAKQRADADEIGAIELSEDEI